MSFCLCLIILEGLFDINLSSYIFINFYSFCVLSEHTSSYRATFRLFFLFLLCYIDFLYETLVNSLDSFLNLSLIIYSGLKNVLNYLFKASSHIFRYFGLHIAIIEYTSTLLKDGVDSGLSDMSSF